MASSAEVYTDPSEATYLLLTPFDMPINGHAVWAIAFSTRSGTLITAALSVMLTLAFLLLWNLICFIAILSSRDNSRRRLAALATLWNSSDPGVAFFKMAHYTYHYLGSGGDGLWGLTWLLASLVVFGGSIALGVVGPSLVHLGSAAPVRPSSVYYPAAVSQEDDFVGVFTIRGLLTAACIRALGSIEAVDVTKRKDVNVNGSNPIPVDERDPEKPMYQLDYDYVITGDDFGLQHGAGLRLEVTGSCTTEYSWNARDIDDQAGDFDWYHLWNNLSNSNDYLSWVAIDDKTIRSGPTVTFKRHPDAERQVKEGAKVLFAVIPQTARRPSTVDSSSDPWFQTIAISANDTTQNAGIPADVTPFLWRAEFWVKRNRPALSCWQQDVWHYDSDANIPPGSITNLRKRAKELGGPEGVVKVPDPLLEILELSTSMPRIVTLAQTAGDSALYSRMNSVNGVVDALASSIDKDMERLVLGSYIATQNTFLDATMMQSDTKWKNAITGPDRQPAKGVGDFVIVSPQIQTFSLNGLIIITVVLVAFLIIEGAVTALIRHHNRSSGKGNSANEGDGKNGKNRLIVFKALSITDLFRRDRPFEADKNQEDAWWSCQVPWPDKADPKRYAIDCCANDKPWCRGHLFASPDKPTQAQSTEGAGGRGEDGNTGATKIEG